MNTTRHQLAISKMAEMAMKDPDFAAEIYYSISSIFVDNAEDIKKYGALARSVGAKTTKDYLGNWVDLSCSWDVEDGTPVSLAISISREKVCTPKVVGTKTVEVPDPNAPKIMKEVDVIEWECGSILGATEDEKD